MSTYNSSSAAIKWETDVPKRSPQQQKYIHKHTNAKRQQRPLLYTLIVSCATLGLFIICFQYLSIQANLQENKQKVEQLQNKVLEITAQNDDLETVLKNDIDYDYILDVALNELNMVYPSGKNTIYYDCLGESEYVKQYADIPLTK